MNLVGCVKIKKRQIFNIFSISWFFHFVTRDFFPIYLGTSHVVVIILTDPSAILEPRHPAISVSELHIKSKMVKGSVGILSLSCIFEALSARYLGYPGFYAIIIHLKWKGGSRTMFACTVFILRK